MKIAELTEQKIEDVLNVAPGVIPHKALAPMFDSKGQPIIRPDGSPLSLSYTHAAVYTAHLLKEFNVPDAKETSGILHLPVPFWRSTAVHLITSDAFTIFGMRSNDGVGLHGIVLPVAGGFSKVTKEGTPENIIQCGWRELGEETCLTQEAVGGQMIDLGINNNPIVRYEIGDQKLLGCITDLESQLVIKSDQTAEYLLGKMSLSNNILVMSFYRSVT